MFDAKKNRKTTRKVNQKISVQLETDDEIEYLGKVISFDLEAAVIQSDEKIL